MQPSMKLNVVYEATVEKMDGYYDPNSSIVHTGKEYDYYSLSGLTVTFFKQLPDGKFHIVLCELNEDELLSKYGLKYDDLITKGYTFSF